MTKIKFAHSAKRFSRQWWVDILQTFFWVMLVTLLVWVYADMEFTDEASFKATLMLSTGPTSELKLLSKRDIRVDFELRGNRNNLEEFRRRLNRGGGVIEYDVSELYDPEESDEHVASTARLIAEATDAGQEGLVVLSASPSLVHIRLDRLLRKEVEVQFDYTGATLSQGPEVQPSQVEVLVGETAWEHIRNITRKEGEKPVLKTISADLTSFPTGAVTQSFPIVPQIAGIDVEPRVNEVSVAFTISERFEKEDFKVAIRVLVPPEWTEDGVWTRYVLSRKDPTEWFPTITVRGSRKELDRLRNRSARIDAYVSLTEDDRRYVESWLVREADIHFPKDLQVQLVGSTPTVQFKLVQRDSVPTP